MSNYDYSGNQGDKDSTKRTILFVIISIGIFLGYMLLQNVFFPRPTATARPAAVPAAETPASPTAPVAASGATIGTVDGSRLYEPAPAEGEGAILSRPTLPSIEQTVTVETDRFVARLSNRGGELVSLDLKQHKDGAKSVSMLLRGAKGADGLAIAFGPAGTPKIDALMAVDMKDGKTVEFTGTFAATLPGKSGPIPVTLRKRYEFADGEYMFKLTVTLENGVNEPLPATGGITYSLYVGPQIGPDFAPGGQGGDYRKFFSFYNDKKNEEKPGSTLTAYRWTAIVGKYFAFALEPAFEGTTGYSTIYSQNPVEGLAAPGNSISISRGEFSSSRRSDTYYVYFGPKTYDETGRYNASDRNAFGRQNLRLQDVVDSGSWLPWLEDILKWCLMILYAVVPNYGVAIILLTLVVKLITFPLTKKSSEAQVRMQAFQPKIQELQAKYKSDPQRLNQEMAALYQKEGYNPLSGCLPILIQIPLFFAMYSLFNNHFDLRGALFIPGWIPDLSRAEAIFTFPEINLLIWKISAIRLLPIIYLASQLLYGKMTQQPTGQSAAQMKLMMYGMPILFFFMLYDVPSGLLVYWIASNLFQVGQQVLIKKIMAQAPAGGMKVAGSTVVPDKKKKAGK